MKTGGLACVMVFQAALFVATGGVAGAQTNLPAGPWDLAPLATAPEWTALERPRSDGMQAITFAGLPFRSKSTRVFAWLGVPKVAVGEKVPAMVFDERDGVVSTEHEECSSAASDDWPGYGHDAGLTGRSPLHGRIAKPQTVVHPGGTQYGADKAVDDDPETRWATSDGTRQAWLEVELGEPSIISRLVIREYEPRLSKYPLQYRLDRDDPWQVAYVGARAGTDFSATFPAVQARYGRLKILNSTRPPTIWEFQVFAK